MAFVLSTAMGQNGQPSTRAERDWQMDTNGLSYEVLIYTNSSDVPDLLILNHIKPPAPVCWIDGWGTYSNTVKWKAFLWVPPTNLCRLELFDSKGKAVKKTDEGKKFDLPLTQEQIEAWLHSTQAKYGGDSYSWHLMFMPAHPGGPDIPTAGPIVFSLKPLFRINAPGEYTLHLSLRLITSKRDSNGQFYFPMVWMPEVITKVQFMPEDLK